MRSAHLNTIIPNQLRQIKEVKYNRHRLELSDGDFVDLDFSVKNSNCIVLILHGLEGDSSRAYAKGIVRQANSKEWDACVLNQRGCSGEPNRLLKSYHSGRTDDLKYAVSWLITEKKYQTIYLAGISIGGNMTLKYLGEEGVNTPSEIKAAVTISVPVDLYSSVKELAKKSNWIYMRRFLKTLKSKAIQKVEQHPSWNGNLPAVLQSKSFRDFDHNFTAPINGFASGEDYWTKNSSLPFIPSIKIPTLLITSFDDPFLGPECYPIKEAKESKHFHLMTTEHGGHVGFVSNMRLTEKQWMEEEMFRFFQN